MNTVNHDQKNEEQLNVIQNVRAIRCNECEKDFKTIKQYEKHQETERHKIKTGLIDTPCCNICNKTSKTTKQSKRHLISKRHKINHIIAAIEQDPNQDLTTSEVSIRIISKVTLSDI